MRYLSRWSIRSFIDEISEPMVHKKFQGLQPLVLPDCECVKGGVAEGVWLINEISEAVVHQ
jgi:hypothetical protein